MYYEPETIKSLYLNKYFKRFVFGELQHETHYQFTLVVANAAGSSSYFAEANTTIGKQATFTQLAFHILYTYIVSYRIMGNFQGVLFLQFSQKIISVK